MKTAIRWMGFVTPVALFAVSAFAAIPSQNCVNCQLTATEQSRPSVFNARVQLADTFDVLAKAPGATSLTKNRSTASSGTDALSVAGDASSSSYAASTDASGSGIVFFQPFDSSGFDATFRTPYWNPTSGFINTPTAPWNQGVTAEYGTQLFNAGMIYVGAMSTAPLAPSIL